MRRRLIKPISPIGSNLIRDSWWELPGVTALAAYQGVNMPSDSEARQNLVSENYNLNVIGAPPSWSSSDGWFFSGFGAFDTGLLATIPQTGIIYVTDLPDRTHVIYGAIEGTYRHHYTLLPGDSATLAHGNGYILATEVDTSGGIYSIAGQSGYYNGTLLSDVIPGGDLPNISMHLMGLNSTAIRYYAIGTLKAAVFYEEALSQSQIIEIGNRMILL